MFLVLSLMRYFFDFPLKTRDTVVMEKPVLSEIVDNVSFIALFLSHKCIENAQNVAVFAQKK